MSNLCHANIILSNGIISIYHCLSCIREYKVLQLSSRQTESHFIPASHPFAYIFIYEQDCSTGQCWCGLPMTSVWSLDPNSCFLDLRVLYVKSAPRRRCSLGLGHLQDTHTHTTRSRCYVRLRILRDHLPFTNWIHVGLTSHLILSILIQLTRQILIYHWYILNNTNKNTVTISTYINENVKIKLKMRKPFKGPHISKSLLQTVNK